MHHSWVLNLIILNLNWYKIGAVDAIEDLKTHFNEKLRQLEAYNDMGDQQYAHMNADNFTSYLESLWFSTTTTMACNNIYIIQQIKFSKGKGLSEKRVCLSFMMEILL